MYVTIFATSSLFTLISLITSVESHFVEDKNLFNLLNLSSFFFLVVILLAKRIYKIAPAKGKIKTTITQETLKSTCTLVFKMKIPKIKSIINNKIVGT